jgi:hypothetical protein
MSGKSSKEALATIGRGKGGDKIKKNAKGSSAPASKADSKHAKNNAAKSGGSAAEMVMLAKPREYEVRSRMFTYSHVCSRMLTYAAEMVMLAKPREYEVCSRMLTYAHVCSRMLAYARVCSRMLAYARVCSRMRRRL